MKLRLLSVLLFSILFARGQKQEILINQNIIDLHKAGLGNELIIGKIGTTAGKFDLSTTALIVLKKENVPAAVIQAMMDKMEGKKVTIPEPPIKQDAAAVSVNSASAALEKLEAGIYYYEEASAKYTTLEPSVFSQAKSGSGFLTGLTYGIAKTKFKAVLSGVHANLEIRASSPVFYFIFPKTSGSGVGNEAMQSAWYSNAVSPNEFILIKFKTVNTSKTKGREVVTGSFNSYAGFSGGIDDEYKTVFRFAKLGPGIYKVQFEKPLEPGEYAFIYAGGTSSTAGGTPAQKAFDFSILK